MNRLPGVASTIVTNVSNMAPGSMNRSKRRFGRLQGQLIVREASQEQDGPTRILQPKFITGEHDILLHPLFNALLTRINT